KNGQGRKSSGADVAGTAHFPDDWQGTVITGGYINNAVWALRLMDDGAGFALVDREPLIKSTNRNFRPVDVKFGPDGALYICDWYNPIIGHYQASFRHPDRDKAHGRIWRVTAKGRALTSRPDLAEAPIHELLNALQVKDRWTRQFAKRVLADRKAQEVVSEVKRWLQDTKPGEQALKEALGVLESHEAVNEELVRRLSESAEPGARAYAASAVGRWADRMTDPLAVLRPLAGDTNARVRLHAIVASTYVDTPESIYLPAIAAEKESDPFIEYALKQAVFALKPSWIALLGKVDLAREISLRNLLLNYGGAPEVLGELRMLVKAEQAQGGQRLAHWRILIQNGEATDILDLANLEEGEIRRELLAEAVSAVRTRNLRGPKEAAGIVRLARANEPNALRLAGLWRVEEARKEVAGAAKDRALPMDIRAAAIASLASFDVEAAAAAASEAARGSDVTSVWPEIFTAFIQRKGGASALAKAGVPAQTAEASLRIMNETGRRDEELVRVLSAGVPKATPGPKFSMAEVTGLVAEVRSRGDVKRGEAVLRRAELGCLACHAVKGQGGTIGPDLGAVGTAQPIDFIIGAILEPQKEVKEGYMAVSISTQEGDEYQGYPLRETTQELVIKDIVQNSPVSIAKSRITQRKQTGSPMPTGLADLLSRQEFVDLVRYLSELGK
ncbi:MAG TPA: hypothetical protein VK633_02575, partial [Verrucomicrobiae bacterium]|nr:hypothetical protein [Verrucomicrobiae bacterium]